MQQTKICSFFKFWFMTWIFWAQKEIIYGSCGHVGSASPSGQQLLQGAVSRCCHLSLSTTCTAVCRAIPPGKIALQNIEVLLETCNSGEASFWKCMNGSMQELMGSSGLHHCCSKTEGVACRFACYFSQSPILMEKICQQESRNKLQRCLGRMQVSSLCCVDTKDIACYYTCLKMFSTDKGPSLMDVNNLTIHCQETPSIAQCVKNFSNNSHGGIGLGRCCRFSEVARCKATCNKITSQQAGTKKQFTQLVKDCGFPLPQNKLWGCLLKSSAEQISQRKHDGNTGVKLITNHCCSQASTERCQTWCHKILQMPANVRHMGMLSSDCISKPSERKLAVCMNDVIDSCNYGCDKGVKLCAAFVSRPFQLYRRCNARGELIAQYLLTRWASGHVVYGSLKFEIHDVNACLPDMWKGVACWLALQPCTRTSNQLPICWNDCVELLSNCLKHTSGKEGSSAEQICSVLVPDWDSKDCYSLKQNTVSNTEEPFHLETPCRPNPCRGSELCVVKLSCTGSHYNCTKHVCLPGCHVPKTSLIVPQNSYLKVIYPEGRQKVSKVCQCLREKGYPEGLSLQCIDFGYKNQRSCLTEAGIFRHGEKFHLDCNFCTCSNGEYLCTMNQCGRGEGNDQAQVSGFPCQCEGAYSPVCSTSGRTYSNLCLARCAGESDNELTIGDCWSIPACFNHSCPKHYSCATRRRTCLEADVVCPQHKCYHVEVTDNYPQLEYKGERKVHTSSKMVCGMDGVTYQDEDVDTAMVPVDYHGACLIPAQSDQKQHRCKDVRCSPTYIKSCRQYKPKFSCCSTCGAIILALFSKRELKDHRLLIDQDAVTVQQIVWELRQLLEVVHCDVRGYLSAEEALIIIIEPSVDSEADKRIKLFKLQACHREAERIVGLYDVHSPLVSTNYYLSFLKALRLESSFDTQSKASMASSSYIVFYVLGSTFLRILL